nr:MAG TPA: hypothetical protein [Caudoviricetes sp.]
MVSVLTFQILRGGLFVEIRFYTGKNKADRRLAARTDGQKKPRVWARGDENLI